LPVSSCLMPKRIPQNLELSDGGVVIEH
jgi:hypothetical protein